MIAYEAVSSISHDLVIVAEKDVPELKLWTSVQPCTVMAKVFCKITTSSWDIIGARSQVIV